jgi:phosphopantetheine--protein transferase-like protein
MPVLLKEFLRNGSIIGVWHISESVGDLINKTKMNLNEEKILQTYQHENRKKQWLSYHALIQELIEENYHISYSDFGKPFLNIEKKNKHISITHSGDYSAVIINEHLTVGIDIEKPAKRIERVSERFLSDTELNFIDINNSWEHLTVCWTAKEALFKIQGNLCFDFKEQIILEPFIYSDAGEINCTILGEDKLQEYKVYYRKINDYFLAYVTE